jgi:hypothetical protein
MANKFTLRGHHIEVDYTIQSVASDCIKVEYFVFWPRNTSDDSGPWSVGA